MPQSQIRSKALSKSEKKRLEKLTELELAVRAKGYRFIVGVDEAGRGPLAGPVVAAACSIPEGVYFRGINDSKQLSPLERQAIFEQIKSHEGVVFGVGIVDHSEIDRINIFQASLEAMRLAIKNLPFLPDCLLIDGLHGCLPEIYTETLVKGDSRSQMIAAASIIAKQTRDALMDQYHEEFPQYSFNTNRGYATAEHFAALAKYGPCPIHRRSFSPIQDSLQLTFLD